jgi:hypothetical protein
VLHHQISFSKEEGVNVALRKVDMWIEENWPACLKISSKKDTKLCSMCPGDSLPHKMTSIGSTMICNGFDCKLESQNKFDKAASTFFAKQEEGYSDSEVDYEGNSTNQPTYNGNAINDEKFFSHSRTRVKRPKRCRSKILLWCCWKTPKSGTVGIFVKDEHFVKKSFLSPDIKVNNLCS